MPSTATLARIVRAAGYSVDTTLHRRIDRVDGLSRGDELAAVLELAEAFPARHSGESGYPIFGR